MQQKDKIPADFIEMAKLYKAVPAREKEFEAIEIGGRVMMEFTVLDQMKKSDIIATAGETSKNCMIIVDYTKAEILQFIENARKKIKKINMQKN